MIKLTYLQSAVCIVLIWVLSFLLTPLLGLQRYSENYKNILTAHANNVNRGEIIDLIEVSNDIKARHFKAINDQRIQEANKRVGFYSWWIAINKRG